MSGRVSYYKGSSAEKSVARRYQRTGWRIAERRWRGQSGEIDMVLTNGSGFVFVEVKSSRSHDEALARLTERQIARIYGAASEYLANTPKGQLSDVRFDVATVDQYGGVRVLENAFGL